MINFHTSHWPISRPSLSSESSSISVFPIMTLVKPPSSQLICRDGLSADFPTSTSSPPPRILWSFAISQHADLLLYLPPLTWNPSEACRCHEKNLLQYDRLLPLSPTFSLLSPLLFPKAVVSGVRGTHSRDCLREFFGAQTENASNCMYIGFVIIK